MLLVVGQPDCRGTVAPAGFAAIETTTFEAGEPVQILWHGEWYPARVVAATGPGRASIHYEGYGSASDEDVEWSRVRVFRDPAPGAGAATPAEPPEARSRDAGSGEPPPGAPIAGGDTVAAGDAVYARYEGRWYAAEVREVTPTGAVKIHYLGFGADWDETVARERLRRRGEPGRP